MAYSQLRFRSGPKWLAYMVVGTYRRFGRRILGNDREPWGDDARKLDRIAETRFARSPDDPKRRLSRFTCFYKSFATLDLTLPHFQNQRLRPILGKTSGFLRLFISCSSGVISDRMFSISGFQHWDVWTKCWAFSSSFAGALKICRILQQAP